LANANYNGTRLNDLTALSYSTFVSTTTAGQPEMAARRFYRLKY